MLFTEVVFLFYFLPPVLLVHWLATKAQRGQSYGFYPQSVLIVSTLLFYGLAQPFWLVPLFCSACFDYLWAKLLHRSQNDRARLAILGISVAQNILLLFVFKYWNGLVKDLGLPWPQLYQDKYLFPLPPGISFYTFESMSFVIDVYRRRIAPPRRLLDLFSFLMMFPRFVAGPIVRYRTVLSQFTEYRGTQITAGLVLFSFGMFLKVGFADNFSVFAPYAFDRTGEIAFTSAWLGTIAYALQLYFDFSGYSLMAMGLGKCLGFQFPLNFNRPYLSTSIREFWTRWHISLGDWIRDYLFTPLATVCARKAPSLLYFAIFLSMVLMGVWHGGKLTYLAMGAWFGLLICAEHFFRRAPTLPWLVGRLYVLLAVLVGWVFFRAESLPESLRIFSAMASPWQGIALDLEPLIAKPLSAIFCLFGILYCFVGEKYVPLEKLSALELAPVSYQLAASAAFSTALLLVTSSQSIPFLYFQF